MKLLSNTAEGGRVVEFTREEYRQFIRLANALNGLEESEQQWQFEELERSVARAYKDNIDFSGVFGTILAFSKARFRSNELRNLLNSMDHYLTIKDTEDKT